MVRVVGGVVGSGVVTGAEESALIDRGGSSLGPGVVVVDVAQPGWSVTAPGGAVVVACGDRGALSAGVESLGAAEVEDLAGAGQDGGDEAGSAGQPSCLRGGDGLTGVETRSRQSAEQGVEGLVTTTVALVPPARGSRSAG